MTTIVIIINTITNAICFVPPCPVISFVSKCGTEYNYRDNRLFFQVRRLSSY